MAQSPSGGTVPGDSGTLNVSNPLDLPAHSGEARSVSAQPLPKPEPEPADPHAADEGWALLEALRRRLDDQGALGRKTQVQVVELAQSIGALVAEQRRRAKWANLNSFVAYLIFTLLVGAGFYLLYRSRAHELVLARDSAQRERDEAVKRSDELTAKATARDGADAKAWEIYQLLEAGKRSEAAGKLGSLADLPLSRTERAVLAARAHETQVMEVDAALKAAAASFKAGRYAEVIAPLEAALVSEPAGARASTMRYFLGVAYAKANQLDKATAMLSAAVAAEVDQEDARFQLASALDRAGQYAKARTEYDRFATSHPQSQLAVFAMRRSATLARMPAVAPVPPPQAPAVSPTPSAPGATSPTPAPPKAGAIAPTPGATPAAAPPTAAPPKTGATTPGATTPGTAGSAVVPNNAPANAGEPAKAAAPKAPQLTPSAAPAPDSSLDAAPMSTLPTGVSLDLHESNDVIAAEDALVGLSGTTKTEPKAPAKPDAPRTEPPRPAPKPDVPRTEPPTGDRPTKAPAPPRPEGLPSFPIDRAPPPSPLGPPVEREPAPAPSTPPRGEPQPPPTRF